MTARSIVERVERVRRFNRFYTRQIGVLREGFLRSPFALAEARVLYELAQHELVTATQLAEELGLDAGYLSRVLRSFEERGLIVRRRSDADRRQFLLSLTDSGRRGFAELDAAQRGDVQAMLAALSDADQHRLVAAMRTIGVVLGAPSETEVSYIIRPHQVGDMGWVVHRHGVLYSRAYGWNEEFEALVAEIVAQFIRHFDPHRERCWIAEKDGEPVGSVFLVRHPDREGVAKLRLLLVEPEARGLGIGRRLVHECTRFARQVGYERITLWTNSVLDAARRIYEAEGYRLKQEELHHSFGHELVGQTWDLVL